MNLSNSQYTKVLLFTAIAAAILSTLAVSSSVHEMGRAYAQSDLAGNPNVILFTRGPLDTSASADLDTAQEDSEAISGLTTRSGGLTEKHLRVIQFRGAVRND